MEAALAGADALLTPTTATTAIPLEEVDQKETPTRFARFVNLFEMCAPALPNGFTTQGFPTSLQILRRGYEEARALRSGQAYQQATDWHQRLPPAVEHRPSREPASVTARGKEQARKVSGAISKRVEPCSARKIDPMNRAAPAPAEFSA